MHLITPFKCMLTLALHLPCNWRPQNGTMNKAERAERTPLSSLWRMLSFFAMAGDAAWGAGGLYFSSTGAREGSYES